MSKPTARGDHKIAEEEASSLQDKISATERRLREERAQLNKEREEMAQILAAERELLKKQYEVDRQNIEKTLNQEREVLRRQFERANIPPKPSTSRESNEITELYKIIERLRSDVQNIQNPSSVPSRTVSVDTTPRSAASDQSINLRDALEIIPNFNGTNISIFQFARACERARDMLPSSIEGSLTQMIINKLRGHAYQIAQDLECSSVAELLDQLKAIFSPRRTVNQLRGELGNIFQKHRENILDYVGRVKEIKTALVDAERENRFDIPPAVMLEIEEDVKNCFVNGLSKDVRLHLKVEGYNTFTEAVAKAIQIAQKLESEYQRFKANRPETYKTKQENNVQSKQEIINKTNSGNNNMSNHNSINPPTSSSYDATKSCKYCKAVGHEVEQCRKLAYKRKMEAQPQTSVSENKQMRVNFLGESPEIPNQPPELPTSN